MMYPQSRTRNGFTLIEALIALLVLSVGLLGLARLQTRVLGISAHGKTLTSATQLAQQRIELLRAQAASPAGYDSLLAAGGGSDQPAVQAGDSAVFARVWSVVASHAAPTHAEIRVRVTWTGADGAPAGVTLTSYLAPTELLP